MLAAQGFAALPVTVVLNPGEFFFFANEAAAGSVTVAGFGSLLDGAPE